MLAIDQPRRSPKPTPASHHVYLVRCWREESPPDNERGERPTWRFVVVTPRSDRRQAFGSLEEVFACLRGQLEGDGNAYG
jgi:hypothetical protein